jgi:hypothetical protein
MKQSFNINNSNSSKNYQHLFGYLTNSENKLDSIILTRPITLFGKKESSHEVLTVSKIFDYLMIYCIIKNSILLSQMNIVQLNS